MMRLLGMFAFVLVVIAFVASEQAYKAHQEAFTEAVQVNREDRIAVLLRTCADSQSVIRTDIPVCASFADEIREAADAAEKEFTKTELQETR